jgi:hypothetical protein
MFLDRGVDRPENTWRYRDIKTSMTNCPKRYSRIPIILQRGLASD